ncbi:hypothetical protein H4582DRAFT_2061874 [Lactarius indigo]|nr:hypothetical protein H4582DRAFT_2061874 [Lactarius indigo]
MSLNSRGVGLSPGRQKVKQWYLAFDAELLAAGPALDVPATAAPRLVVLDSSPDLVVALTPGRLLHCVTLRIASTLYDGLRPAALFGTLGGVPGNTGTVLEPLERSLDGTSDEVLLQALYKQVGSPLPNFQVLRTLPLRAALATEVAKGEEGSSRLTLWTRSPLGSVLLCVVFLSGAHWELEQVICRPSLEAGSQPKPAAGSQAELEPLEILWAGGYGLHLGFKIAGYRPKKKIKRLPVTVHVANLLTPFKSNMSLTIANQYTTAHVPRTRAQHLAMYRMPQDLHMSWVFVPLKNSQSHGPKAGPAQAMGGGSGLTFSRPKPLKAGPKPQLSGQAGPANHYSHHSCLYFRHKAHIHHVTPIVYITHDMYSATHKLVENVPNRTFRSSSVQ